jgi:hypothetical protein
VQALNLPLTQHTLEPAVDRHVQHLRQHSTAQPAYSR